LLHAGRRGVGGPLEVFAASSGIIQISVNYWCDMNLDYAEELKEYPR